MAYEIKPWKQAGCSLSVKVNMLSKREPFSREINEAFGEGGGLNANYRTVEAGLKMANIFGKINLLYGVHFVFKSPSNNPRHASQYIAVSYKCSNAN